MIINRIVIKNFKNLIDFSIETNKESNIVFIGNNGSGKSNILEALSSIFASLYEKKYRIDFKYLISYTLNNNNIVINNLDENIKYIVNKQDFTDLTKQYLPSQIVSAYSGEESRLWKKYYEPFYKKYIEDIKGRASPNFPMIFLNRYYWNIGLLTLFFYDFNVFTDIRDFCTNTLNIKEINFITFHFNVDNLKQWEINPIVNFVKQINPNNEVQVKLKLDDLKKKLENIISDEKDFFKYLSAAYLPKQHKLITEIIINFDNNLTTESLSEGEKKLILIELILEVIGDQDSLILLDEPDSHVHISRKRDLQKLITTFEHRNTFMTTHSPTLTHCFEDSQIKFLERDDNMSVKVKSFNKYETIKKLTDGIWNYHEQTIFLTTAKDILLVEGKTDALYILTALKKLKTKYKKYMSLDFEVFPFNGAGNLINIINKINPKNSQAIIAFLDRDKAGLDALKEIFPNKNNLDKKEFSYAIKEKTFVAMLPCKKYYRGSKDSFLIEDYLRLSKVKCFVYPKDCKSFATIGNKENIKKSLANECINFTIDDFLGFRALFDLILEIKTNNNS